LLASDRRCRQPRRKKKPSAKGSAICRNVHLLPAHASSPRIWEPAGALPRYARVFYWQLENIMGRGLLLWLIGIPLPIILIIWLFGGLS
jgi:hypothetical protein